MFDITLEIFESEVIHASMKKPVLIDFWASWCMPCSALGPILGKLEIEYDGRFILGKIDVEAQQQLAQAFGIRSVPTVILLYKGKPVDGFTGAVSEAEVRAFLDKHLPQEEEEEKSGAQQAAELAESGQADAAIAQFQELLAANPGDVTTRAQFVELLLQFGRAGEAREVWQPLAPLLTAGGSMAARPAALLVWIEALESAVSSSVGELEQKIEQDKRDFPARYALAQYWLAQADQVKALDELLEIIMRDKVWNDGAARKMYVGILELMTPQKAQADQGGGQQSAIALERQTMELDPQQKLVADYRRQLSMVLN